MTPPPQTLQLAAKVNSPALPRQLAELAPQLPALFLTSPGAAKGFIDFFTATIRNRNTRRAYFKAASRFSDWCKARGLDDLARLETLHVSAYVEELQQDHAAPTVKQHLAALRMLFDWLVVKQVMPTNPAHPVRGPKHSVRKGKTPVLNVDETRELLNAIATDTVMGLRDRALIALMVFTFARVGAAVKMRVEDYFIQGRKGWVRLHEKGSKMTSLPCHHRLDEMLEAYIMQAEISKDAKGWLFRAAASKNGTALTERPMSQQDVHAMIRRRAAAAGIKTKIGCHTFRATGITAYLKNGGRLEVAQQMAGHESSRTTGLYDRRGDDVSLDEVERIAI
ncbi:MAG TPA: tyrosine-type recombinase/integrase [Bryobacteraceae bacterium]|jgi:site-specific recombinase XerD